MQKRFEKIFFGRNLNLLERCVTIWVNKTDCWLKNLQQLKNM